jgi:subtilase family serine protease
MTRLFARFMALATIAVLSACSSGSNSGSLPPSNAFAAAQETGPRGTYVPPAPGPWALRRLCPYTGDPRERRCMAIQRLDLPPRDPNAEPQGYSPADLQSAYALTALSSANGRGQTVAVVDAFDDPNAEADLAIYRAQYHLPACTTANGCFRKLNENGLASPLPRPNGSWAGEESLDVDMVSAICPNCHIMLFEGGSLDKAVNSAVRLGANVVSNSYGGAELDRVDPAFVHPGVVFTASAGDGGYFDCDPDSYPLCGGPEQPASYATVVAVGGTRLTRDGSARGWSERVWNDETGCCGATGSGCSRLVPKPDWQTDKGCTKRSETDISAEADPDTPVAVYDSYKNGKWIVLGGTSVSSPLVAGVFALAGNAAKLSQPQGIWERARSANPAAAYNDVTLGNNIVPASVNKKTHVCPPAWRYICYAGPGYDGPTGWGTPNGISGF